ncbi:hypothetical protein GJ744_003192 [Endocarpon pusillum]|uniref:Myb-like domain-containing protein n=1 Tax=Endocarpon pusillum TaxID=364733 RepID=A0A8H7E671_9EURO|nr:hypothetical protein GJ744_003192 [Endocarpon pusillum]
MGGFSEMDSKSLIAAALAPHPGVPDPGKKVKKGYSNGPITPNLNVTRQKSIVPSSSGKRRRRASSVSSQTSQHEDNLPVSKKSRTNASIGEKSVTGLRASTNNQKTAGTSNKNSRPGGNSRYDNNETQAHSVSTKQREETKKPAKPVSSYVVSSQGRAELEANPELVVGTEHQRKVRSAYGENQDLGQDVNHQVDDDRDNHECNNEHTETQLPNPPQSSYTRPANKKPSLTINSDLSTPSPPETPSTSSQHDHETDNNNNEDDDDDDDGDDEYTNTPPSRRKKTRSTKSTANKSKSKARIASTKNRKQNFPVASAISEASEADKMMFRMKGEGKSWKEITAEWTRMTGRKPGFSTLSVRFGKLQEKFARMGDMDFHRLLKFKSRLETVFNKYEKWDRIATMILEDGGAVYTGQALRMKYRNMVEVGLHTETGGVVAGGGDGVESAGVEMAEEGGGDGAEVGSFDEWDRELMGGDENGEIGGEETGDDVEGGGTMPKMGRKRGRKRRQVRPVELPRYRVDLDGESDEDDENFVDGELVGGGGAGAGGGGGEDMSE